MAVHPFTIYPYDATLYLASIYFAQPTRRLVDLMLSSLLHLVYAATAALADKRTSGHDLRYFCPSGLADPRT